MQDYDPLSDPAATAFALYLDSSFGIIGSNPVHVVGASKFRCHGLLLFCHRVIYHGARVRRLEEYSDDSGDMPHRIDQAVAAF